MENNKKIFWWLALISILVIFVQCHTSWSSYEKLCYHRQCFALEIADTPQLRTQWLMYRTLLPTDQWMLFVFPQEDMYDFWMKNTLIPLDMIWMDASYTILDIQEATPCIQDPCPLYRAKQRSRYVLELGWWIAKMLWLFSGAQLSSK